VPPRHVTLVLCTPTGDLLGALPPFEVPVPWWQQVDDVVSGAQREFGLDVRILRLLTCTGRHFPGGGPVSYLAEVNTRPELALRRWPGEPLSAQPLRLPYATPGGHALDLAWAQAALEDHGRVATGPPQQIRCWNLSSIWRLTTDAGHAWLKVVPPFFAHEGAVLPLLNPAVVPEVIAAEPGRVLLADVLGPDQYEAGRPELLAFVQLLVRLQAGWIDRTSTLLESGVPDLRPPALLPRIEAAVDRNLCELTDDERRQLGALVATLPRRFADIAACGLPNTLVHGDFHPGNVRGTAGKFAILDWGDCAVGNPMIDQLAFGQRLNPADRGAAEELWAQEWQSIVPGCDAGRAAALLRPVTALYQCVVYQHFLDNIEPDERPYHSGDQVDSLRQAARLVVDPE